MNRVGAAVAGVAAALLVGWFVLAGGDEEPASPPAPELAAAPPSEEPDTASADAFAERLASLREDLEIIEPARDDGTRGPLREAFLTRVRLIADEALQERRPDVSADLGRILTDADELNFAGAVLQRAVGLMKPDEHGKDHLFALAVIRREQGKAVEAASLYERAVHVEPTRPAEFVGLSDCYLAADRIGPARAAVTRGLRVHEGDRMLEVQGAKVMMLSGRPQQALAVLTPVLTEDPSDLGARIVQVEAQLAAGQLAEAATVAEKLRAEAPEDAWGWILGAAVDAARGGGEGAAWLEKATELAGDCPCTAEERDAIEWARAIRATAKVEPRSRSEVEPPSP